MMTEQIQAAIGAFRKIILGGVPLLLRQDETAFLSFMCSLAAIDALAAYRYTTCVAGIRFRDFITEYFPTPHMHHMSETSIVYAAVSFIISRQHTSR
jgi:hypothetical protein